MKNIPLGNAFSGGTVANDTTFSGNVIISGTLGVTGVATFTTTVTGSGNIMAGAAFALGFTGRGQFKSSADGLIQVYDTAGTGGSSLALASGKVFTWSSTTDPVGAIDTSIGRSAAGVVGFYSGVAQALGSSLALASDMQVRFSSNTDPDTAADTSVLRVAAGIGAFGTGAATVGSIRTAIGTSSATGVQMGAVNTGWYVTSGFSGAIWSYVGTPVICIGTGTSGTDAQIRSDSAYGWSANTTLAGAQAPDTCFYRASAGVAAVGGSTNAASSIGGFQPAQTANGATLQILAISELLTLSTSGTTTDTTANLLPANSLILTVVARITTTIVTATDWKIGDGTTAGRFTAANATLTANTTDIGKVHITTGIASATTGVWQSAAAKVRITTTGTPSAGIVRLTTFYMLLTPPTS